jgi:hypothetical protein
VLAVILALDKTMPSVGTGDQALHPLYIGLGNVKAEAAKHRELEGYVPKHELDTQPRLVTGGTMKEYQVDCSLARKTLLMSIII